MLQHQGFAEAVLVRSLFAAQSGEEAARVTAINQIGAQGEKAAEAVAALEKLYVNAAAALRQRYNRP